MKALALNNVRWINPGNTQTPDQLTSLLWDQHQGLLPLDNTQPAIDATGLWLVPALVDCNHHLARPQHGPKLARELEAAWRNGFASVCAPPDCTPVTDNASVIEWIEQALDTHGTQALPELKLLGALSPKLEGNQLSDMAALLEAGCVGLSHADAPLPNFDILRQALRYAHDLDAVVHLNPSLASFQGCAHDGVIASALGLSGTPAVAEALAVNAIIELVKDTGCQVHLSKLSAANSLAALKQAKLDGLPISADVSLWNLLFNDSALSEYDPAFHLHPPLRTAADQSALIDAVASGVIDAICSDHRPLGFDDKFGPFAETTAGANGVDGFLAGIVQLIQNSDLSPVSAFAAISSKPASIISAEQNQQKWLLIDPCAEEHWPQHSRCPHNPLSQQQPAGRLLARNDRNSLWIDERWHARLGV